MGTQMSKTGQTYTEKEPDQGSLPSTPILTPKNKDMSELDPRSPSANIVRTPIQLQNGLNKTHTPIIGEINTSFEITTDEENTFENPSVKFDPRSPTVEFTRTPIIIEKSGTKLRNKNLEKVKNLTIEFSPVKKNINNTELSHNETVKNKITKPIFLESSPISRKNEIIEKRKSYVGLLETNLDFIETDLDKVQNDLQMIKFNENISSESEEKLFNKTVTENPGEKIQKLNQIEEEIMEVIEVTIDPTNELDKSKLEVIVEQENIQTPNKNVQKLIETENAVLDFDKKISNLIFEDQSAHMLSPKQNKLKDNNRTPLGDRNRISTTRPKSTASKLKVHDKPRNEYTVSKIPVFRDKKSNNVNCENTPPTSKKQESRIKKSQWDAEKTLII